MKCRNQLQLFRPTGLGGIARYHRGNLLLKLLFGDAITRGPRLAIAMANGFA